MGRILSFFLKVEPFFRGGGAEEGRTIGEGMIGVVGREEGTIEDPIDIEVDPPVDIEDDPIDTEDEGGRG